MIALAYAPPSILTVAANVETVTLRVVAPDGSATDISGITALKRAITDQPTLGNVAGNLSLARFHLRASQVTSGVRPDVGDRIVQSSGATWVITEPASLNAWGSRWQVTAQLLEDAS